MGLRPMLELGMGTGTVGDLDNKLPLFLHGSERIVDSKVERRLCSEPICFLFHQWCELAPKPPFSNARVRGHCQACSEAGMETMWKQDFMT